MARNVMAYIYPPTALGNCPNKSLVSRLIWMRGDTRLLSDDDSLELTGLGPIVLRNRRRPLDIFSMRIDRIVLVTQSISSMMSSSKYSN